MTSSELRHDLLRNRLRGFWSNFTAAARTECLRNARPEKLQIIVDLRHCPDGRTGSFDGIGLLNGDRWRDAADIVDARLVLSIEELPHVWTKCLDVTSLAFSVNCLEGETRFTAAARAGDDGQFSERKIDVDAFQVVLPCAPNLNAIIRHRRNNPLLVPDLRTHWRQFQIAARFANFPGSARLQRAGRRILRRRTWIERRRLPGASVHIDPTGSLEVREGRMPSPARRMRALPRGLQRALQIKPRG